MSYGNRPLDRARGTLKELSRDDSIAARCVAAAKVGLIGDDVSEAVQLKLQELANLLDANHLDVNHVQSEGSADPELSEPDACELIDRLRSVSEMIRDEETERILKELRHHGGSLPEDELKLVCDHATWFGPKLLLECRDEIARLEALGGVVENYDEKTYNSIPFFSLHLFSQWNLTESIPVVLDAIKLPTEGPFELFGDCVHELVPRYLAQFLAMDLDLIDELICDTNVNLYVRWSATNSYAYLVRDEKISLEAAVARLDRLFDETKVVDEKTGRAGLGHAYELSAGIAATIQQIGGASISALAKNGRDWDFVDQSIILGESFLKSASKTDQAESEDVVYRRGPTRVVDVIEELRHWACFNPKPGRKQFTEPEAPSFVERTDAAQSVTPPLIHAPIRSNKTPRNAKCPCGSGKKYKKCCIRKPTVDGVSVD